MTGSALRRLMAEYKRKFSIYFTNLEWIIFFLILELIQNPPEGLNQVSFLEIWFLDDLIEGIVAGPLNEDNFFEWESLIT